MKLRVLIAVTHLLGVGHLTRAAAVARGLAAAGHDVTLISGGEPAPLVRLDGVRLIQLPPVHVAGTAFSTLLGADGAPVGEEVKRERRRLLAGAVADQRPDVIVTELFPFGRRVLADEFLALAEAGRTLRPRALILSSVRDVLVAPSKEGRVEAAHERLLAFYDGVLVHGDAGLLPLERSWPVSAGIAPLLHYTGYVDERARVPVGEGEGEGVDGAGEIVVSGGGSAASLPLLRAAIGAARLVPGYRWRLLAGRGVLEDAFAALVAGTPANARVERARADFPLLLSRAALSVSQAGYNTVLDILRARVRAVVVPFEAGNETEQRLRAESLSQAGIWPFTIVPEAALSAEVLARAANDTLAQPLPRDAVIDLDGVANSVAHIGCLARRRRFPALSRALDDVAARGGKVVLWWRDDDAVSPTAALDRLLALAARHDLPVAIAAIPAGSTRALAERLQGETLASVLVHGLSHANHAPAAEKKAEFGPHRPLEALRADAGEGLRLAREVFGARLLPVFVPPWNRIAEDFAAQLAGCGFIGLSGAGKDTARDPRFVGRLPVANIHVDPVDWRGGGGLRAVDEIDRRAALAVSSRIGGGEKIILGLLTHHLVQDEATWALCDDLLSFLLGHRAVERGDAKQLFL